MKKQIWIKYKSQHTVHSKHSKDDDCAQVEALPHSHTAIPPEYGHTYTLDEINYKSQYLYLYLYLYIQRMMAVHRWRHCHTGTPSSRCVYAVAREGVYCHISAFQYFPSNFCVC